MELHLACPGCRTALHVPERAVGKHVRCPQCHRVFTVPQPRDLIEDTISHWIEEDLEAADEEKERYWEQVVQHAKPAQEEHPVEPPPQLMPQRTRASQIGEQARKADQARRADRQMTQSSPASAHKSSPVSTVADAGQSASVTTPHAATVPASGNWGPLELLSQLPRPHLAVAHVSHDGVMLSFDARWLEHPGFGISMPVRCPFEGEAERSHLTARPLAFIDRSGGQLRNPRQVEAGHEQRLLPQQTPRDLHSLMGLIDGLPKPFNHPVIYYVTPHHLNDSLTCTTTTRTDGGVTCHVMIPDHRVALDWVARVNGICGDEYHMLEKDVTRLQADPWRKLPEAVRRRIGVWCKLDPSESFRLYLSDTDFGTLDSGLAGIVVTDQRLVYCKFHHRGQVRLNQYARLDIELHERHAELTLVTETSRNRIISIHRADVPTLTAALTDAPTLQVRLMEN